MRSYIFLVVAFAFVSLCSARKEPAYERLSEYLETVVGGYDIQANLKAASEWLVELARGEKPLFRTSPLEEVKQFTTLQQVVTDTKCDRTSHELIKSNMDAVNLSQLMYDNKVVRHIDIVLKNIFSAHQKTCENVYPVAYREKLRSYLRENEGMFIRVQRLAEMVVDADRIPWKTASAALLFNNYIWTRFTIKSYGPNVIHRFLLWAATNDLYYNYLNAIDSRGEKVVDEDKIKLIVIKNVITPCKDYEAVFGPDIFEPARTDAHFTNIVDRVDNSNLDYFWGWTYYKNCQIVTNNEKEAIDSVIASVKKEM